jgi:ABC-type branched-subunit amino acid transport system ATPase component/ABC-type branched-subunit amino acid transport system permease subunit
MAVSAESVAARFLESPVAQRVRSVLGGRRTDILLIALALAAVPPLTHRAMPKLFHSSDALVLSQAVALAAAALSLNMLLGYAGQISLGHAALLGVGAFASGVLTGQHGLPMWVGVPVGCVCGAAVAFLLGIPSLRLRGLYLAMVTLAFGYAAEQSLFRLSVLTGGSAGVEMPRRLHGNTLLVGNPGYLAVALVVLLTLWLVDINVCRTKLGRAFQAIRQDEAVAQAFGVDVTRYKLAAFTLSGAFAGIAGALYGHAVGFVNSETFNFQLSLLLVIVVVVGGLGHRGAVVTTALFFTLFPRFIKSLHGYDLILGALLLMFTVSRHPGGLASMARERRERKAQREERRRAEEQGDEIEDSGKLPSLPELPRPPALPVRATASDAPLLEAVGMSVRFGGLQALNDASLVVPSGGIVGLIGPNGAGKTTLFNAISGHVRTQSGRVRFLGEEVQDLPAHERARRGMARSFQLIGLAKELSVRDNFLLAQHQLAVYSPAEALGYTRAAARVERALDERAREAVAALGFEQYLDTPVRNLSHGQQRIVEIGCLLATSPELLMLDEPSVGMSPAAAENLAERLRELPDRLGRTVLLIEHNLPLVLDVCDHLYVLHLGEVLAEGDPQKVVEHDDVVRAYLGDAA